MKMWRSLSLFPSHKWCGLSVNNPKIYSGVRGMIWTETGQSQPPLCLAVVLHSLQGEGWWRLGGSFSPDPLGKFLRFLWTMPLTKEHRWLFQNFVAFYLRALERAYEVLIYFLFNAGILSVASMIKFFPKWWVGAVVGVYWERGKTGSFF